MVCNTNTYVTCNWQKIAENKATVVCKKFNGTCVDITLFSILFLELHWRWGRLLLPCNVHVAGNDTVYQDHCCYRCGHRPVCHAKHTYSHDQIKFNYEQGFVADHIFASNNGTHYLQLVWCRTPGLMCNANLHAWTVSHSWPGNKASRTGVLLSCFCEGAGCKLIIF